MTKLIVFSDILTEEEIDKVSMLFAEAKSSTEFHNAVVEFITPLLPRLNERLQQENDPHYVAYMIEAVIAKSMRGYQ